MTVDTVLTRSPGCPPTISTIQTSLASPIPSWSMTFSLQFPKSTPESVHITVSKSTPKSVHITVSKSTPKSVHITVSKSTPKSVHITVSNSTHFTISRDLVMRLGQRCLLLVTVKVTLCPKEDKKTSNLTGMSLTGMNWLCFEGRVIEWSHSWVWENW